MDMISGRALGLSIKLRCNSGLDSRKRRAFGLRAFDSDKKRTSVFFKAENKR